ncbi:MAG: type II toxin-antitoxin system HicB family antitoxin [Candidatus Sungbacteria bacterium]|nr:type II toxin-antitoxin system HicB family antitoxin [Candidatus Sungbacteria bacterium]
MKRQTEKKMHSYPVLYKADPEGGFVVFAPTLPGCHTQGETLEEAERNIAEAIELYLECLVADKASIPEASKSFYGMVNVQTPLSA